MRCPAERSSYATGRDARLSLETMTGETYEDLVQLSTDDLNERARQLKRTWQIWDRKSDPRADYTDRQRRIEFDQEIVDRILRERAG